MEARNHYCTYGDYVVKFDSKTKSFLLTFKGQPCITAASVTGLLLNGEKKADLSSYSVSSVEHEPDMEIHTTSVTMKSENAELPELTFAFTVSRHGLLLKWNEITPYSLEIGGEMQWGAPEDAFAANLDSGKDFRAALGPAVSLIDYAVYNKKTDSAICIPDCPGLRMRYDFAKKIYPFTAVCADGSIRFEVHENLLAEQYDITFVPLKKRSGYAVPPAGWMTWYAVGFNASEETVLQNLKFQEKYLKAFGANTLWVDWEWYHKCFESRRNDGVDTFHPDPVKYPHGLKFISDEIKKAGFTPALWIGFTNDLSHNWFAKEHPEMILCEEESWCGTFFYDYSHPAFLNEFLPLSVAQVKEWGYETVKFDTLPISIQMHEKYHDRMYNPEMSTRAAYQQMVGKVRSILGDDVYMLSCSARRDCDVLWGAGIFDAARIGDDVARWQEFQELCVDRAKRYYPLHNIVIYNDPDNVVLREEHNTFEEAMSRVSFVSLLGMPVTFGDDLPTLPPERVDLLRRALPVQDIHPMSIGKVSGEEIQIVNLSVALPFEAYNVVQVMNSTSEERSRTLRFCEDLHLEAGEYYVYDYFRKKFLGLCKDSISISFAPHGSSVLCVRRKQEHPQVISTSRHITQGAAELKNVLWEEESCTLKLCSELPAEDVYTVTVSLPEGYEYQGSSFDQAEVLSDIVVLSVKPEKSGEFELSVQFSQK